MFDAISAAGSAALVPVSAAFRATPFGIQLNSVLAQLGEGSAIHT